jgi:hemerythrin-like domain-containing protein
MPPPSDPDHFEALDACHRDITRHLAALSALARHIDENGIDDKARRQAATIEAFFSGTSRQHHRDEEHNVFPDLLASGDAELVQAVRTLQQDHGWIEENWIELAPRMRAIAAGNGWTDPVEFQNYVEVFTELLKGHIALEETLIYPESKARWAALVALRRPAG